MTIGATPLYQTQTSVVDVNGNVEIYFNGPGHGRVWQGTISIIRGSTGKQFEVVVGGQAYGYISTPGPGGPYQLSENQNLILTSSGLTAGDSYTAILAGVDEPSENASSYTGPTSTTQVTLGGP